MDIVSKLCITALYVISKSCFTNISILDTISFTNIYSFITPFALVIRLFGLGRQHTLHSLISVSKPLWQAKNKSLTTSSLTTQGTFISTNTGW